MIKTGPELKLSKKYLYIPGIVGILSLVSCPGGQQQENKPNVVK